MHYPLPRVLHSLDLPFFQLFQTLVNPGNKDEKEPGSKMANVSNGFVKTVHLVSCQLHRGYQK